MIPSALLVMSSAAGGVFLEASNNASDVDSPAANAQFSLTNAGTADFSGSGADPDYTWLLSGSAGDYDARFTLSSGSISTGTAGTWQNLATSRSWGCFANGGGTQIASGTIEIRDASTLAVLASGSLTLDASSF